MNSDTNRRPMRISLRMLFILVTLAALIAYQYRPRRMEIVGHIDISDLTSICAAVKACPDIRCEMIAWMDASNPSEVEVFTSEKPGRGGDHAILSKNHRQWIVISPRPGEHSYCME